MEDGCTWPLEDESPVVIVIMIPYLQPRNNDGSYLSVPCSFQGVQEVRAMLLPGLAELLLAVWDPRLLVGNGVS